MNLPPSRRRFVKTAALAAAATPLLAETTAGAPETLVQTLYTSLDRSQREKICFGFDHALRSKVDNNWRIVKDRVGALTAEQQDLVKRIFLGIHSPGFADTAFRQVASDNGADGLEKCSVALFGEPGTGKFEFVLSGRHVTRRCDGDSVEGAAFGGPIFYGHASGKFNEAPDHPGNVYWFQAKRANELFQALAPGQRKAALRDKPRGEQGNRTVELKRKVDGLEGLPFADLDDAQKKLARQVLADLVSPFRKADADEAMKLVEAGGFDQLHLAYFQAHDVGNDEVWDTWQVEGPHMIWLFRGKPHVHTWVHIAAPA